MNGPPPREFENAFESAVRGVLGGKLFGGIWTMAELTREGVYPATRFVVSFRAPTSRCIDRRLTYRPWHAGHDAWEWGSPELIAWMLHDNCLEYFDTADLAVDQVDADGGYVEIYPDE